MGDLKSNSNISIHYSSHKINKIRFLNRNFHNDSALFVTGTNHPILSKNKLSVWGLESRSTSDEVEELASIPIDGIITELKIIELNNKPMIIGSTSKGSLFMYSIYNLPNKFEYVGYDHHHHNKSSISTSSYSMEYDVCNLYKEKTYNVNNNNNNSSSSINSFDISFDQQNLITVSSDGIMNLLSLETMLPIYTNRYIDGLGVNVIKSFNSQPNQVITSGELGKFIKFWDIRSNSTQPVKIIKTSSSSSSSRIFSLAIHQDENIIAAGSNDGHVNLYDIRNDYSIDQNKFHNSDVWELSFNKSNPNQLYSCSEDGFIYQYTYNKDSNSSNMMGMGMGMGMIENGITDKINNTFDIYNKNVSLLQLPSSIGSIDSFDINTNINRLICCSTSSQCLIIKSL